MKIKVKVHANSSQEKVVEIDDGLEVWIKEKPINGKANAFLEKFLKKHFGCNVKVASGVTSRIKLVELKK